MTRPADHRRRRDRELLQQAATALRLDARGGQAQSQIGQAPMVPYARYAVVGLLEELAWAAGRGELPAGVRRLSVEVGEKLLADLGNGPAGRPDDQGPGLPKLQSDAK